MSIHILRNDVLSIKMDESGAELTSIFNHRNNTQYLWNANPDYWQRHAPILFPFVGKVKNGFFNYQGQAYPSQQHGFARDKQFLLLSKSEEEIWFYLEADKETYQIYPFLFRLEIGYRLEGHKITCYWKVINQGDTTMYFSIGGHPAFYCPIDQSEEQSEYFLSFDNSNPLSYLHIDENGLAIKTSQAKQNVLSTDQGIIPIGPNMFDLDALIFENNQCHRVSLLDPAKSPYLTVTFDAPLFGLWSPARKNAPFLCIEPWYGRCDASDFNGTLEEREYSNSLEAGKIFEANYSIDII